MRLTMDGASDFELMARAREGDSDAFGVLVTRHKGALDSFFRQLGAGCEAEDLVQETFVRVFRHRSRYTPCAKFTTFLYTVARNVWTDRWRKWARWQTYREAAEEEIRASGGALPNTRTVALRLDVQTALASLPEKLRVVLILSVYQGMTYAEISEVLDIPVGTVKSRVFHALARLKEFFDEDAAT